MNKIFDPVKSLVLQVEDDLQIRLAINGPDELGENFDGKFFGVLFGVMPKRENIIMLRSESADSYSVLVGWARNIVETVDLEAECEKTILDETALMQLD